MSYLIDEIVNHFKEEKFVFARVILNAEATPVVIEYEPNKMTVNHLGEDLPPFLRFLIYDRKVKEIQASSDRIDWKPLEEDIGQELKIYLLLNPTFLLPRIKLERPPIKVTPRNFFIEGSYHVGELDLSQHVKEYFEEEGNIERWIKLYVIDKHLLFISQQDFPPFQDTITLLFSYMVPPIHPLFFPTLFF